jgi:hypothetical protein
MNTRALWSRRSCRLLLVLQSGLVAFCIYYIIDAYTTPYVSEWLTADAFVPYLVVAILFFLGSMFLTSLILRSGHPRAWLWLLPIAAVTVLPYVGLIHDAIVLGELDVSGH